jgi:hypothetical protein
MGRAANRKWRARRVRVLKLVTSAKVTDQLDAQLLHARFKDHPKFNRGPK